MPEQPAKTADEYIRRRLTEGARDAEMVAKELVTPKLDGMTAREQLEMLLPVVRAYTQNRVKGWKRAIDNMAGRDKGSMSNEGTQARGAAAGTSRVEANASPDTASRRQWGPEPMTPLQAREARLSETMYVPGKGNIWNRDATREDFQAAIRHLEAIIAGNEKSIAFYRRCIAAMDKHKAQVFGEVPVEVPLD